VRDRKRKQCEANSLVFYIMYSFTARPLTSFYDIIERTIKALKIRIYEYMFTYSLTLLLSYSLNKDGWIPTRVGHECRG
jgi:hypothetical protein